jgi:thioredoxin-like negative regulator of GroEL
MLAKTLEDVKTELPIEVVDIDVNSEVAIEFGIRGVPTLVMVEDGTEIKRVSGMQTQNKLEAWLND